MGDISEPFEDIEELDLRTVADLCELFTQARSLEITMTKCVKWCTIAAIFYHVTVDLNTKQANPSYAGKV